MKKTKLFLLPLLLVGSASFLTSCGEDNMPFLEAAVDGVSMLLDSDSGREIYMDYDKTLQAADYKSYLGLKSITFDEQELEVEWKYDETKWYRSTYLADESRYKFTPIYSDDETAGTFDTTLTVEIKYKNAKMEKTWDFHVTPLAYVVSDLETVQKAYAADNTNFPKKLSSTGKVVGWLEPSSDHLYAGVYVADGEYGMMLYAGQLSNLWKELNFKIGDNILFCGSVEPYSGLMEVKPSYIEILAEDDPRCGAAPVTLNGNELGYANLGVHQSALISYKNLKYKSVKSDGDGGDNVFKVGSHVTITCEDETGAIVPVRINYHIGKTRQTELKTMVDSWTANSTIFDFEGVVGMYAPDVQLCPVYNITAFTVHTA